MAKTIAVALLALCLAPATKAVRTDTRLGSHQDANAVEEIEEKSGSGDNTSFRISIAHGNSVGRVFVKFPTEAAQLSNQGFARNPPHQWQVGQVLGKADDFVWPIQTNTFAGMGFDFDHGVSDIVFGDILTAKDKFYRPEFQETVYTAKSKSSYSYHATMSADQALQKQLREEQKERYLSLGTWKPDGYFVGSWATRLSYNPRLRIQKGIWESVGDGNFQKVVLERPGILDIDNLFNKVLAVPNQVRYTLEVNADGSYKGNKGIIPSLGKCKSSTGVIDKAKEVFGLYCGRTFGEQCATQAECGILGGRWKDKYCSGSHGCGCCKEIGQHATTEANPMPIPIEMTVQWLAPVLAQFKCVPVSPEFAKTGGQSLFIAMGWDTESDVSDLDIDLSLVPVDKMKRHIRSKVVYYGQQTPTALRCGRSSSYGGYDYAMRAFNDDRSGDEPGDDELVKINLACLSQYHSDIEAIVVVANIYAPSRLTWNQIDSCYMRLIAGGREMNKGSTFFIHDAESVRSFVRLSGDGAKEDRALANNALAVGMLFRDSTGKWAFASLLHGMPGRSAISSVTYIESHLRGLEYPLSGFNHDYLDIKPNETNVCVGKKSQ